jgi:uncharacterized SAM-binding protein YcdF (DUF218 family)
VYFYLSKILAPLINFTNFLIFGILILYIFYKIKKNYKVRIFLKIFVTLFLFVAILPIGNFGIKLLESEFLNQKKIKKIDNIFVLAGSENLEASKLTFKTNLNNSSERLIATVKLGLENPDAKIYFLGGQGFMVKNDINESYIAKSFFSDVGFNTDRIDFVDNTKNTIENLRKITDLNISNKSNILITSAFHMKRALIISRKFKLDLIPYAVDFRSIKEDNLLNKYQKFNILDNLFKFDLFIRELLGIISFKILM